MTLNCHSLESRNLEGKRINAEKIKTRTTQTCQRKKAKVLRSFFKTGKGQYGEGDQFLGVTVPEIRRVVKQFNNLSLVDTELLLQSPIHEERLSAVLILVDQFKLGDAIKQKAIYTCYIKNAKRVNNWDLVDLSAHHIVGGFLFGKDCAILKKLAKSQNLWERRIAIIATFYHIYQKESKITFEIAEILLHDKHDLIHKAVGWMLREVGKRVSQRDEENFLKKHYKIMPRTMLRYAIERFEPALRKKYLEGTV